MSKPPSFNFHRFREVLILTSVLTIATITPSLAYLDPGSTGALVTAILGFFAAIGYTFRKWFYKLRTAIFGGTPSDDDDE